MTTPRLFIVRHGETEWSLNGRHTGVSDIPLTANGEKRIRATGRALVGKNRLIVPKKLAHIYVSPRKRAQRTFELLHLDLTEPLPWQVHGPRSDEYDDSDGEKAKRSSSGTCEARIEVTEAVREWDYGDYEGITSHEIEARRAAQDGPTTGRRRWDIWKDGCPGGESPADITARLDALIAEIRSKYHAPALAAKAAGTNTTSTKAAPAPGDVLIVAHGHILRALAMRWVGAALQDGPTFLMEAGGVGTLSYEHNSIDEPAILLGGSFSVDLPAEK